MREKAHSTPVSIASTSAQQHAVSAIINAVADAIHLVVKSSALVLGSVDAATCRTAPRAICSVCDFGS